MLKIQVETGYRLVGIHVQTRDNIARAIFERWENGECVDRNVTFDAPVAAVEAAMNGPIPNAASLYDAVGQVVYSMALTAGRIGGRVIAMNAPDPKPPAPAPTPAPAPAPAPLPTATPAPTPAPAPVPPPAPLI